MLAPSSAGARSRRSRCRAARTRRIGAIRGSTRRTSPTRLLGTRERATYCRIKNLKLVDAGVFWPLRSDPLFRLTGVFQLHRLGVSWAGSRHPTTAASDRRPGPVGRLSGTELWGRTALDKPFRRTIGRSRHCQPRSGRRSSACTGVRPCDPRSHGTRQADRAPARREQTGPGRGSAGAARTSCRSCRSARARRPAGRAGWA